MKRSIFSPPDPFSLSPLLSLLPVKGDIANLQSLTSSLFARHEAVSALRRELEKSDDRDARRRLVAEETMLKRVLEWLAVSPQQLGFGDEIYRKVEQRRARWDSGIGYEDQDIFEAFLKLPVPQRKLIREVILTFAKVHQEKALGNSAT